MSKQNVDLRLVHARKTPTAKEIAQKDLLSWNSGHSKVPQHVSGRKAEALSRLRREYPADGRRGR